MKNYFYFLLVIILFASCKEEGSKNKVENISTIKLNFSDYDPMKHKSFIDLKIENLINPIKQQLKISDSGTVNYVFRNDRTREVVFNYENRKFSQIISPNEELNIELKISELLDWKSKFAVFKSYSGENEVANNLILANTFYIDSLIKLAPDGFSNDGKSSDIDYKIKRISEMHKQLDIFDSYITTKGITNKAFVNWSKAQIRYRAGNDLSIYPFFGIRNREINDKDEYFNFINEVNPENFNEMTYHSYLEYIETLSTSYKFMSNVANNYSSEREELKKDSLSFFPIIFNIIKRKHKSTERELIMSFAYRNNAEIPQKYQDSIKHYVSGKMLKQIEFKKRDETLDIISLIKNFDIPENEKTTLLELYNDAKGKVVFNDFWFTNCGPCMSELPNYNDLITRTNSEEVEFIFYGAYMSNDEWKKTIEKYKLQGKHHLLTKNQIAFFEKYFGLHGFPHHQLIKSNGNIGEKVKYGVYPSNFDNIKELIEKHLVE